MSRLAPSPHRNSSSSRRRRLEASRRSKSLLPLIEGLEDRVVLSTITWNTTTAPNGGDWDTATNWVGNTIPTAGNDAVIDLTSGTVTHNTGTTDSVNSLTTNATTALTLNGGSLTIGAGPSQFNSTFTVGGSGTLSLVGTPLGGTGSLSVSGHFNPSGGSVLALGTTTLNASSGMSAGGFTVAAGATLAVGPNVPVLIGSGLVLTDNGSVTFATGDVVTLYGYYNTSQIVVNGALTATSTTFATSGSGAASQLVVNSGGHLMATSSVFNLSQLYLNPGNVFSPGDLSNNAFNLPLYIPYSDVALLSGTGSDNKSFQAINIDAATLPAGQTLSLNLIGTSSTANLSYYFSSGFTVAAGATLAVGPNVPVLIGSGLVLTDNGSVTFATGDVVTLYGYYNTSQIVVNGALTATSTTFATSGSGAASQLVVNSGGHLMATSSVFNLSQLYLNPGNVFSPGDLSNNAFNLPLYIPYSDVALLSGTGSDNKSFQAINIDAATLPAGQTLSLNLIGTSSTANLSYYFSSGFTVAAGATLAVGPNVPVLIGSGLVLTDNGSVTFATGDVVTLYGYYNTSQIVVNGALTATSTTFATSGSGAASQLVVNSGGHLMATSSVFNLSQLYLNPGNVFSPGDLSNNAFNLPLYIPYSDVALLSGTGSDNKSFQAINIDAATLPAGQTLSLNLIGTSSTANLSYYFSSGFTVAAGATLAVGPNVPVLIGSGLVLTDNGSVTFATGDVVTLYGYYNTSQIVVNGALTATSTTFATSGSGAASQLVVNSGGHLMATSSVFNLSQLYLNPGNVFSPGDLSNNAFNLPLYIPYSDVALLSGTGSDNKSFQAINIDAATLPAGQTLSLNLIGTSSTANLSYYFSSGFTVAAGATLAVGPNVPVLIGSGLVLTDNGSVTFATGDVVTLYGYYNTSQIVVNGALTATSTTFATSGSGAASQLVVNSGGHLMATSDTFGLSNVTLYGNSNDTLTADTVSGVLTIYSTATISIHGNDFSNIGAYGIVAVGDPPPAPSIDLTGNFWGTSNATTIQTKIRDNFFDATRPKVNFGTPLGALPATIAGVVFNDINGNGVQDSGEPGLAGVLVYIDANNSGSLAGNDATTITDATGHYLFDVPMAGTYVVRETAPAGTLETSPTANPSPTTISFEGTGSESGVTGAGVSSFSFHGASFSGGTVYAPSQAALIAAGTLVYNTNTGSPEVDFSMPVSSATFFYVHGSGIAPGTATAFDASGNVLGTVTSKAATTKGDPANFVTLSFAQPIARITLLGGVVDNFTFAPALNNQAYYVRLLQPAQAATGINFGDQYGPVALEVQSFTPTTTGFAVTFNAAVNTSVLNLYDAGGQYGSPDVTLVGQNTGPVTGSLVVSPDGKTVTFVRTAGLLVPDTYTLTLVSGANAFKTTVNSGGYLDGIGNGVPGSNLVTTFTVAQPASNAVVVSIPSFARGYGQAVNIPAPTTNGLPITLSTGLNVSAVDLTLHYNPALLTLTGFTTSIAGAVANANLSTPGLAILTVSSTTAFSTIAGAIPLGTFTATVPNTAPYGSKEVLDLTNLAVFDASTQAAPLPSLGQDGVHVAAFFGDTNGDGAYTTQDVTLEQRLIVNTNTGFAFFKQTDPVLLGDISGNGQVQGNDTTLIQRAIGQIPSPNIPALPTGIAPPPSGGPDPTLFIPNLKGKQGDVVTVPVRLTVGEAAGITLSSFEVAISYDPSRFSVDPSMPIGSTFGALGSTFVTFPAPGEIIVQASSPGGTATIPYGTTADLFDMTFSVLPGAAYGPTVINLLQNIATTTTGLFANDANVTSLTLSPAPSDQATDSVDGTFTVGTLTVTSAPVTSTGVNITFNQPFSLAPLNLYDTATAGFGPADLTLVGASTGPVQGSLIVNPGNQSLSFLKTGGVLVPDTYTLTLRSAANGFTDAYGGLLDGNADGTTGDNYVTTFTVAPSSAVVVAVPDFARGPGQAVVIPAASGSGLPLTISDGTNVTSIGLSLSYNPSLLTISGANLGPSAPAGSSVTVDTSTPGTALLTFTSPTALATGLDTFATLVASVPASAPYASKEALVISNLVVDGGAIAAVDQDGVHAVAYLGDTTGNGGYSSFDATLVRQVVANISTGFAAYPLLDPRIVGDIAGFGTLSGIDATYITQYVANLPQPRIPALPNVTIVSGGPDPLIWLPQDLTATPGSSLAVPVQFRQTNGSAIGLASASLAIEFDPGVFEVTGIRLGDVTSGFVLIASYDNATGEVIATERSASGAIVLAPGTQGTLLYVDFLVRPGAPSGSSRLNLLGEGRVGSSVLYTSLNDGGLTLVPAPTDSDFDPVDGVVNVGVAGSVGSPSPSTSPTGSGASPGAGLAASVSSPSATTSVALAFAPGVSVLAARSGAGTAVTPSAVDRAIEALLGEGDAGSAIDSPAEVLIPWSSAEASPDLVTPVESSNNPAAKKGRDSRVLLALATPAGVSFGR